MKNEFKIEFQFPKEFLGNYLVTYYAHDSRGGTWIEQTASIQDGVAFVDGITRLPTIVYITDASSDMSSIALYVERGNKIHISGDGNNMASWTVTGNKISERWSEWRKNAKSNVSDNENIEKSIGAYVRKNPSDKLSVILMLTEWDRRSNPDGFLKLWNSIDKGTRSQELVEICGATDLLGVEFTTKADGNLTSAKDPKLKKVVFRSRDNGVDTLNFNKVKGSLLYFYTENNSARKETADTIRALSKAYPDSLKRIISDIAVDTDSMTWIVAIRSDSVSGVIRAWQPKGIAEEDMVRLGIVRIPWFIVKDKDGNETYRGDDLKKATAQFRKEMTKKDSRK
ncbi:MAG: hypothetical protein K2G13_04505 [Muribaculaceae bacterium]|nr:hypothetical protein [Muribaculaceae bacterium]